MTIEDAPTRQPHTAEDRYLLHELIGSGGMADVYRGKDRVLGRAVAVKVMRNLAPDYRDRERFTSEAELLARLDHRGLVGVLDIGSFGDRPYIVMELVEGVSLADCCRGVALDPRRVAAIGAELADALSHVHAAGVVHRDIKPSNVLLDNEDRVRLTDFGIAKLLSNASCYTATGTAIGTAAYLSPEQVRGELIGPSSDVYSLGLVLLEALTGVRAYPGTPIEAALARLSTGPRIPEDLPGSWRVLLYQMTSTEPAQRPAADTVARRLRGMATGADPGTATSEIRTGTGDATGSTPVPPEHDAAHRPATPPRAASHRSSRAILAATFAVAVLLAGALFFLMQRGPEQSGVDDIPPDTPSNLREPLQELHDAVEGR